MRFENYIDGFHLSEIIVSDGNISDPIPLWPQDNGLNFKTGILKLKSKIITKISDELNLEFEVEKQPDGNVCLANSGEIRDDYKTSFASEDLLNYITAALYSGKCQNSRQIPYPKPDTFWQLVRLGDKIRKLQLFEEISTVELTTKFCGKGGNIVDKVQFKTTSRSGKESANKSVGGNVFINATQYFENIPESVWNFTIGACKSAQEWLINRVGCELTHEDILYYRKLIFKITRLEKLIQ